MQDVLQDLHTEQNTILNLTNPNFLRQDIPLAQIHFKYFRFDAGVDDDDDEN